MALTINKVADANVYVNNTSTHGQASQVVCPQVEAIMNEYNSLGMIGTVELPAGFSAMEATITWTYPSNEVQAAFSDPFTAVNLMVRSNKSVWNNGGLERDEPVSIIMRGLPKQHSSGTFAGKDAVEVESALAVNYYKLEVDGTEILEIDVINNIFKVDGVDRLAQRRRNLGI